MRLSEIGISIYINKKYTKNIYRLGNGFLTHILSLKNAKRSILISKVFVFQMVQYRYLGQEILAYSYHDYGKTMGKNSKFNSDE